MICAFKTDRLEIKETLQSFASFVDKSGASFVQVEAERDASLIPERMWIFFFVVVCHIQVRGQHLQWTGGLNSWLGFGALV